MARAALVALAALLVLAACADPPPPLPLDRLFGELASDDPTVRAKAAEALGAAREKEAERVVPRLVAALKDSDRWVRDAAALSLTKVGPPAVAAIDALIAALHDEDDYVRYHAAQALAYLGPAAKAAIPRLEEMARDDPTEIGAYWSKEALRRIRGEPRGSE